jgi:hypothetical protein
MLGVIVSVVIPQGVGLVGVEHTDDAKRCRENRCEVLVHVIGES